LRNEVKPGQWIVSGGAPVLAAALLVNLLFPAWIAAGALTVMLTGDIAAALIGRKFGRHKLVNGKSLEGTVSFIIVGYIALAVVLVIARRPLLPDFAIGLAAVLAGGLAELFQKQLRLDDNLSIPLSVGLVLLLALL
ncbi:MAG: phosphatidate cytidylyltransferase, partial [Lentisphaeria bacterium]|nr:phosphatidate cytidylyltransferase [Lentisphaeria bacterium]